VSFQLKRLTDNWSSEVILMGGECKTSSHTSQRKLSDSLNTHKMNTRMLCVFHVIFLSVYEIQSKSHPKPSCGYPPSQWCRSLEIAIECGVSKRLIQVLKHFFFSTLNDNDISVAQFEFWNIQHLQNIMLIHLKAG